MKFQLALVPALAAALLSACNGGSSAGSPGSASAPVTKAPVDPNSNVAAGESCTGGDADKLCLAIHFVSYKDSVGNPTASTAQAATIIHTMNQLFAGCNIGFQIETYEAVNPEDYGLAYGADSVNQLNDIRATFDTPSDELLSVTTGPWGTAANAWTNMPGNSVYGAIMESSIVDYAGGLIYAHEFGHYLGLDHVSSTSQLMSPIIYTSSTELTSSECQTARDTIDQYWKSMIRS